MRRYIASVELPEEVQELTRGHMAGIDAHDAGLLVGLYVIGSVAPGDFRPQWSDIDFVGVLGRVPTEGDLAALAAAHGELVSRRP